MNDYLKFLNVFFIIIFVYVFICSIVNIFSLWKIFKKENIPPYYSIIPFVNIYYYFKLCKLPFWTIFIPVLNIITVICSSYVIAKVYKCKHWQCIVAIFFPLIILPYIAFSNRRSIYFSPDNTYIKSTKDIDRLEKSLNENNFYDDDFVPENNNNVINDTDNSDLLNQIEGNLEFRDEYVYDDYHEIENENAPVDTEVNEFTYLDEDVSIDDLTSSAIDELEENLKVETSVEKNIVTETKEYKEIGPSKEAIAFGGKKKIENVVSLQSKNKELTCIRCGSSLVDAKGICPGCGAKIEDISPN